jgi:acyl-CoA reductase-like NAD-dependent aldehyde dehydrogenase
MRWTWPDPATRTTGGTGRSQTARVVKAAAAELRANAAEYARYVTVEMGKLIRTAEAEVGLSAAILDYYADHAETFLAPEELPESPGAVVETELGGSDPLIVLEDADLKHALAGALVGRMFNTGQSCVSSKRIIVVGRERGEAFLRGFSEGLGSLQAGDPADPGTTLGPLSSEKALDLLLDQIRIAKDGGAHVILGGDRIDRPGYYLQPTILTGINEKNPASTLEFFGPVASFYVVDTEDEAIEVANATRSVSAPRCSPTTSTEAAGWPGESRAAWCTSTSPRGLPPRFPSAASRTPDSDASSPSSGSASS